MTKKNSNDMVLSLSKELTKTIAETNGIYIKETLELLAHNPKVKSDSLMSKAVIEFRHLLSGLQGEEVDIKTLCDHPVADALFQFFKRFPICYHEEHIHLTGSLDASFIYPRLMQLLDGPNKDIYEEKIKAVYGKDALPINSEADVDYLIRLKEGEKFDRYLKILYLAKLVLNSRQTHAEAAYHMASKLYNDYNVGSLRLKFTLSRGTGIKDEQVPGIDNLSEEDVVLGLYQGFKSFQSKHPWFRFFLVPSFRKESNFYDHQRFSSKEESFLYQVDKLLSLLDQYPELEDVMKEVDTVGDEKHLYRKKNFEEMKKGLRKLQYRGFSIRSHHGETWLTLKKGVQAVDNAMNIWHVDTLEHGLSLGINPNYYFHRLFQKIIKLNQKGEAIEPNSPEYHELKELEWPNTSVLNKLVTGRKISSLDMTQFIKTKFYTAIEIEQYQHDILNRMLQKQVSLVALPSSNMKLTGVFPDYKIHPFSWWEKKGAILGVGTDNYVTLNTNYIYELMMLLFSDPQNLKITKLIMVATKEERRPRISSLLWEMRKRVL